MWSSRTCYQEPCPWSSELERSDGATSTDIFRNEIRLFLVLDSQRSFQRIPSRPTRVRINYVSSARKTAASTPNRSANKTSKETLHHYSRWPPHGARSSADGHGYNRPSVASLLCGQRSLSLRTKPIETLDTSQSSCTYYANNR